MEETSRPPMDDPTYILYAKIWPRTKAMLIDGFLVMGAFLIAAFVGSNVAGTGAFAFLAWFAFWVLYDPLMVSRTGGTIGHHMQNLKVVSDRTGIPPSLIAAFIRNIAKSLLGIVSLLAMAGSSRQKALHDWIAGTTVQASNLKVARLRNFTRVSRSSESV